MRRSSRTLAALLVLGVAGRSVSADDRPAFRVIVNPDNPAAQVERKFVADAFLKKVSRWPDNELLKPVDRGADSRERERFSDEVLGRSVAAVKSYWQQLIFSGRGVPPAELDSDENVVNYVVKHRGAIGYVSAAADVGRAKVVTLR